MERFIERARLRSASSLRREARSWLLVIAMVLLLGGCSTPGVEVQYTLAASCEEPPPPGPDDFEARYEDFPTGLDFLCGELHPSECFVRDGEAYAVLEASSDRIDIEFLGDRDRLSDRCDTDLGVRIVVVAAEPTPIDPSLPVFFHGMEIQSTE